MKFIRRAFMIVVALILGFSVVVAVFMQQPQFGRHPSGERASRISSSPNYRDGKFQNISPTPDIVEGVSYATVMKEFFFNKSKRNTPDDSIPAVRTNLHSIPKNQNVIVWFGHSSYFIQRDGKRFLVDPVMSGAASPVKFTTRSFAGADAYTVDDIPPIDYLLITHDHWDHLDYETVVKLKSKVTRVVTGLGTGEHLERWGYPPDVITEKDWNEQVVLDDSVTIDVTSARHFSGRGFRRNQTLWVSFVLTTPSGRIFIGGDSGYDRHFKEIGDTFGPFDLAILECGQYNNYWRYIHMLPEETAQAAVDLKAKTLLPVHWSKFSLALHDWDEPIRKVIEAAGQRNQPVIHPMIGEITDLDSISTQVRWWENIKK